MLMNEDKVEMVKALYPPGTRIKLVAMGYDPRPIPSGMKGTVVSVDDIGTIHCSFDNGRRLGLIYGEDFFHKIRPQSRDERLRRMSINGINGAAHDKGRKDVLLHTKPADPQPVREHRISESGHGHGRERLLFYLEWLSGPFENRAIQDGTQ